MENNELLQAIKEMMVTELKDVRDSVKNIDKRLTNVESDMTSMKSDMTSMKSDMNGMKSDISDLKREVQKTNLTIENHILPAVQALREGHMGVVDKLDVMNEKIEDIEESVIVLKVLQVKK